MSLPLTGVGEHIKCSNHASCGCKSNVNNIMQITCELCLSPVGGATAQRVFAGILENYTVRKHSAG